uniref:Uncharacterized protein n=1 Tax=Vitis vinifera TaxID=29760 RepID=F6HY16_VITVI
MRKVFPDGMMPIFSVFSSPKGSKTVVET